MARINSKHVGSVSEWGINEVERGAIRRFCEAIAETNPVHLDDEAAKAAGFKSLVAPPTFAISLRPGSDVTAGIGLDARNLLHSEQEFEFFRPLVAGDVVHVRSRIADLYERKGPAGNMQFLVIETTGQDPKERPIFTGRQTIVVFVK